MRKRQSPAPPTPPPATATTVRGPLTEAVAAVSGRLAAEFGAPPAAVTLHRRVTAPLQVAVVGRVSSGKSTLVNALLEKAVAPTAAGECTRVPCWFSHGPWTTATVRHGDGTETPIPLVQGRLPSHLDGRVDESSVVDVRLSLPLLSQLTLVDTPGLASTSDGLSERTARILTGATEGSTAQAEAIVVVLSGPLRADEAEAVTTLQRVVGTPGTVPAVAALTKVDLLDQDPHRAWKTGQDMAHRIEGDHADLFSTVVPVLGLLAETAAVGGLTETDTRHLAALAEAWTVEQAETATRDARLFLALEGPVYPSDRQRLLDLLGLLGSALLIDAARTYRDVSAARFTEIALTQSGREGLTNALRASLSERADLIKATAGVASLRRIADSKEAPSWLGAAVDRLVESPTLFPLRLHTRLAQLSASRTYLPQRLGDQVRAARLGQLPPDRNDAVHAVADWRRWQMTADGPGQRAAEVMVRAWQRAATVRTR